jgi:FkbM family methyltransferase
MANSEQKGGKDVQMGTLMIAPIPHRRPFLDKLRTSALKRRVRLARWIAGMRGRSKAPVTRKYFDADFVLVPGELISAEIEIERYEWWELTMMLNACREYHPVIFVDVGANIGLYTCVLGRAQAARKLLAFEPDGRNFARLSENVARNGLCDIVDARQVAAGAAKGTASLMLNENSALTKLGDTGLHAPIIDVIALDDLLDIRDSMICIKIDVEGHELEVVAGAVNLFRSNGGYAQIECHGDKHAAEIAKIMYSHGWRFIDRHHLNLLFVRVLH